MIGVPLFVLFSFLPSLLDLWSANIIGEEGLAALAAAEGNYEAAGVVEPFVNRINPLYIIQGLTGLSLPLVAYTAYRERNI